MKQWGQYLPEGQGYDFVATLLKQGKHKGTMFPDNLMARALGTKRAGRLLDGVLHDELMWQEMKKKGVQNEKAILDNKR